MEYYFKRTEYAIYSFPYLAIVSAFTHYNIHFT